MNSARKYYKRYLAAMFSKPWALAELLWTIGAAIGWWITKKHPDWDVAVTDSVMIVGLAVLGLMLLIQFIRTPYVLHKEDAATVRDLKDRLDYAVFREAVVRTIDVELTCYEATAIRDHIEKAFSNEQTISKCRARILEWWRVAVDKVEAISPRFKGKLGDLPQVPHLNWPGNKSLFNTFCQRLEALKREVQLQCLPD